MKMVYTNEKLFVVSNVKNILDSYGIDTILKNEFTAGVVGEVSAFDAWVELWLANDSEYEKAIKIIESALSAENESEWLCNKCNEKNDASFEFCWSCQGEPT